ncbi:MAG: CAP domain-containing protein [Eubacteriales bacterium]
MIIVAVLISLSGCYAGNDKSLDLVVEADVVETTDVSNIPTSTIEVMITAEITPTIEQTAEPTIEPTPVITATLKPTQKITAAPTKAPEIEPTAEPTPEPTTAPSYTVISSSIRNGALQGINDGREEEGNPLVSLSSSLNAKAEAHAIEMAKADSLYHSSMGYVESIRSGANIGGWAEGYAASCHATQLATDESITQIGVGSAISSSGTVYTCIIGGR